jgi:hypothetical protein
VRKRTQNEAPVHLIVRKITALASSSLDTPGTEQVLGSHQSYLLEKPGSQDAEGAQQVPISRNTLVYITSKLTRANSAARFDKIILIYDLLFIYLKSLTLNLHVDIGVSILKLVLVHPNFVVWVWSYIGGWKSNSE